MKIVMRKGASETNNKRSNKYLNAGFCCVSNLKKLYIIYLDSLRHLLYHHYRNHLLFAYLLHASLDEITKKERKRRPVEEWLEWYYSLWVIHVTNCVKSQFFVMISQVFLCIFNASLSSSQFCWGNWKWLRQENHTKLFFHWKYYFWGFCRNEWH